MYDSNVFTQIIPELSATINARPGNNGVPLYSYRDLWAGRVDRRTGRGEVRLSAGEFTVAILHAHWINTTPSPGELSGSRRIESEDATDLDAAQQIREAFGDQIKFFIYKWNGVWREFQ